MALFHRKDFGNGAILSTRPDYAMNRDPPLIDGGLNVSVVLFEATYDL